MTHRAMAAARTARRGVNAQPPSEWNRLRARLVRPLFEAVPRGVRHALAYVDAGRGHPAVFLHGNPASSYLRRDILQYRHAQAKYTRNWLIWMPARPQSAPFVRSESATERFGYSQTHRVSHAP